MLSALMVFCPVSDLSAPMRPEVIPSIMATATPLDRTCRGAGLCVSSSVGGGGGGRHY